MKKIITVLVSAAFVGLISSCFGGSKAELPPESTAKEKPKAAPAVAEKKNGETTYRLLGQVSSQEKILLSFKVTGIIRSILVKPGSQVKKGQAVAELDNTQIKLQADAARLQFERAENQLKKADLDFRVEQELHQKEVTSKAQFLNAEVTHKNAVVARDLAEVDHKTAQQNLHDSRLTAPADGTISDQLKFAGDKSDGPVFEMYAAAPPEIFLNAPESLLSKVSLGAKLDVTFPSINVKRQASIVRVVPAVREKDRTFLVVARLVEPDPRIVPGIFAEAIVITTGK